MSEEMDVSPAARTPVNAALSVVRYVINPAVSRFTVKVFASGLLSAFGHSPTIAIRDMQGEIEFNPLAVEQSSLRLVVRADSLSVADSVNDKDRREIEAEMRARVLEVEKYSQIVYESSRVAVQDSAGDQHDIVLLGQLSLHGVTRSQQIAARVVITGEMLRAFGEFSLRQSHYNIKPVSAVGGGLKVKDEVKLTFDIVARRPE